MPDDEVGGPDDFIADVAARHGCEVTGAADPSWHLAGTSAGHRWTTTVHPWTVDLVPPSADTAARITWRCADLPGVDLPGVDLPGVDLPGVDLDAQSVVDGDLARMLTVWPDAWWGPGERRPAGLEHVRLTAAGLEIVASGWWHCAAALEQMITLGAELTDRLRRNDF